VDMKKKKMKRLEFLVSVTTPVEVLDAEDAKKEGKAPGVAQGAGTACQCMRGTVSPCHVALSKDKRLLVWVRPCGPSSTISEMRSRSEMALVACSFA